MDEEATRRISSYKANPRRHCDRPGDGKPSFGGEVCVSSLRHSSTAKQQHRIALFGC